MKLILKVAPLIILMIQLELEILILVKFYYQNVWIYDFSHKNFMGLISLLIRFDKINGLIGIYDGIRYLVSLGRSWYDEICDKIKYLISEKKSL